MTNLTYSLKANPLTLTIFLMILLVPDKVFAQVREKWVAFYNVLGISYDNPQDVAVDNLGNVYITGGSMGSGTSYDFATIKYSQNVSIDNDVWMNY